MIKAVTKPLRKPKIVSNIKLTLLSITSELSAIYLTKTLPVFICITLINYFHEK
jgi:hypothetical protein